MSSLPNPSAGRVRLHHHLLLIALGGTVASGLAWWQAAQSPHRLTLAAIPDSTATPVESDASNTPTPGPAPISETASEAEELVNQQRAQLLGRWEDQFYGRRVFEFHDDGTATMELELDSVGKLLYGPKLRFFVAWELKDGILNLKMTGGEPSDSAVTLAKLFGESSQQRVESITADELQLRSLDSQKLYKHRRLAN